MASRTKSFFGQNYKVKQTKVSHGPRQIPQHRPALGETSVNAVPSKPSPSPNAQAKTKQNAIQCVPGQPEPPKLQHGVLASDMMVEPVVRRPQEAQGKDCSDPKTMTSAAPGQPMSGANSSGSTTSNAPQLPHAHTFPCTPGTRLPLEDLIGHFDEHATRPKAKERSPEEQLGWIPNSSSTLLTPNRRRKRARSSSPPGPNTSSQRQEISAFFPGNGLGAEKTTPLADPAAELWERYAAGKESVALLDLAGLDQLVLQATPKANATPIKSASLRRWASTGNDWPSTKSKRQKLNARTSISVWQDQSETDAAGRSKVAEMVEKMQESLATQRLLAQDQSAIRVDGPSSSDPLPERGGNEISNRAASAASSQTIQQQSQTLEVNDPRRFMAVEPAQRPHQPASQGAEAEGTDLQSPNLVQDSVAPISLPIKSKVRLPPYKRPSVIRPPTTVCEQYAANPPPQPAAPAAATLDEFDEYGDAFELSAEDLDELISQAPRPLYDIPQHPNPPLEQAGTDAHVPLAEFAPPNIDLTNVDDDDEFGDGIDEAALAEVEFIATQAFRTSPRKRRRLNRRSPRKSSSPVKPSQSTVLSKSDDRFKRFKVQQVIDGECTNAKGRRCPEKVILAEAERTSRPTAVAVHGSWTETAISAGHVVHVAHVPRPATAPRWLADPPGQIVVDDDENSPLLVVHPDHMLSATTVADSFDCIRKAVLQDRIKATGESSKPMVYGNILHSIFQQALSANQWDRPFLAELTENTVQGYVEQLWELGMVNTDLAVEEVTAKMGELAAWAKIFVGAEPTTASLVDDKRGEKIWLSISKLIAIEEHIWSPRYGLKGNIDATVQSTLVDHPKQAAKKLIAPFEVKTGLTTNSPAHRAQTALYTLLLSDRYDVGVEAGILYYLESSATSRIAPPMHEIRQMVQQRNRLAAHIHRARHPQQYETEKKSSAVRIQDIEEAGLPGMLKNPFKCGKCYAQQSCFSYHALVGNGTADSAGMIYDGKKDHSLVWQDAVGHLALSSKNKAEAATLKEWFTKWDRLLTFEESELSRIRKELWTMSSAERESVGRCFGSLVIDQDLTATESVSSQVVVDGIGGGGKINRFVYRLRRAEHKPGVSFTEGTQLTIGEPVVVSSEACQWALANGYVIAVSRQVITIGVDRKLGAARQRLDGFDEASNHAFRGTTTFGGVDEPSKQPGSVVLYRLDKDEFANGLALIRNSLVSLMSSHPIHTKLRNQVVFNTAPSFATASQLPPMPPSQLGEMNDDQRAAVSKVLSAQDYALILGMPGTGKTTTIAHIIRALLAEEKTILLSCFTHTAVDNILLKIRDIAPPNSILRLGVLSKINQEVQKFCHLTATPRTTIDEIESVYMGCKIVATTCMGTNHAIFNRRAFDVCIVDEASQITVPTSLGPLLYARKFVLVGDHYQLPPLVQNRAALEGGLDVSLFRQLSEEHPEAVATLGRQYRMCEDIMSLSNTLIYGGRLQCGNEAVARRTLQNTDHGALDVLHAATSTASTATCGGASHCWLTNLLQPEAKVRFANTDALGKAAQETLTSGKNITNGLEAALSAQLVLSLIAIGVPGRDIGVITLYRSQLALMRQLFKAASIPADVELDSADRFQGRDKECIILSMVRSNDQGIVGELLKDWRRVNVALTRARSKLIVLGSRKTLASNDLLARFLVLVDERGWSLDLPVNADACHNFDFGSQATVDVGAASSQSPANARQFKTRKSDKDVRAPG